MGLTERIARRKDKERFNRKDNETIGLEGGVNRKGQRDEKTRRSLIGTTMTL